MSDSRPIGIFDSGIGGLTVVHEVFRQLPDESVVYFGDTARVPYGTKSAQSVQRFAMQDAMFLLKYNVKMIVVACHTASAIALNLLCDQLSLPVFGVTEPGGKAALKQTRNGKIGVIGTRGTIHSKAYDRYMNALHPDIFLMTQPCPLFVPLAEEGWMDTDVTERIAQIYLSSMKRAGIDTLILGCTHYPLLKGVIQQVMGSDVILIDSAEETVRSVKQVLQKKQMNNPGQRKPIHRFFVSDIPDQFQEIGERFLGCTLSPVEQVDMEVIEMLKISKISSMKIE
ncbi:glutamate racemase [bacterium]|nr:glutamate racemase [bacterium]RQV98213.1 MAG: glutamate racemase [bacterium]